MYTESTALFLRSSQQRPHTPRNGEAYRSTAAPASSAEPKKMAPMVPRKKHWYVAADPASSM